MCKGTWFQDLIDYFYGGTFCGFMAYLILSLTLVLSLTFAAIFIIHFLFDIV